MHTMGSCASCPGMWPSHMDYNWSEVANRDNLFGQPKTYAVMDRDLSKRFAGKADPWNLMFNFKFLSSGSGKDFDNRGIKMTSQGNADISATNGKTTTAAMDAAILECGGRTLVHNRAGANMAGGLQQRAPACCSSPTSSATSSTATASSNCSPTAGPSSSPSSTAGLASC